MSVLKYNNIEIIIQKVLTFDMRDVYTDDHTEYLYTHYLIEVQGVINPQATSFDIGIPGVFRPGPVRDQKAGRTVVAIRHDLLQPRKLLTYDLNGVRVLESPQRFDIIDAGGVVLGSNIRGAADAKNGPHPIDAKVTEFHGTKTLVCTFKIETFLRECAYSNRGFPVGDTFTTVSPVLAHRWEMREIIDDLFLSTRVIDGWAVFRSDVLLNPGNSGRPLSPDDFRARLFHPISDNFKRTHIDVAVSEDNLECRYQIIDEEQVTNLNPASGIAKMECDFYRSIDWSIMPNPPSFAGGDAAGIGEAINFLVTASTGLLPSQVEGISVKLWGVRGITEQQLANAVVAVVNQVFQPLGGILPVPFHRSNFRMDLVNRYAELKYEFVTSGIIGAPLTFANILLKGATGPPGQGQGQWPDSTANDLGANIANHANGPNIAPQGDLISRSQSLGRIIAQALAGECFIPAIPTNPGLGQALTLDTPAFR